MRVAKTNIRITALTTKGIMECLKVSIRRAHIMLDIEKHDLISNRSPARLRIIHVAKGCIWTRSRLHTRNVIVPIPTILRIS